MLFRSERLAEHYDLPVVSFLKAVVPEFDAGGLAIDSLMHDQAHPNDSGHLLCGYLLYRAVAKARQAWDSSAAAPLRDMPAPLLTDFYQSAGQFEDGDSTLRVLRSEGWMPIRDPWGRQGFIASDSGAELELECGAPEVTLGYMRRIDQHGEMEIRVDGAVVDTLRTAFPNDWGGGYTRFDLAYKRPVASAPHRIVIRLISPSSATLQDLIYAGH